MELTSRAADALRRLDAYVRAHDYTGPDPYDALGSPAARALRGRRPRQALVQLLRRSPIDLRPALRVPPTRMSKALALFCSGLSRATQLPEASARAQALAAELRDRRTEGAWGYEFDVQTRWAFYPAGSPNIIATAFVVEAGHDLGTRTWDEDTRRWFEQQMIAPPGYIRYVPDSDRLIHNANILGARALFRLVTDHPAVTAAARATVAAQRADGLWPYGDGPGLEWVDNFHTAYVLMALAALPDPTGDISTALDKGTTAWLRRCFASDGTPRYYADRDGPADVHNVATSVYALTTLAATHPACNDYLPGAVQRLLRCQRADGAFVAAPRAPAYMRWNQAHAYLALAALTGGTTDHG